MKTNGTKRQYWRSLEHLAESPEIQEQLANEFASYDPEDVATLPATSRRRFLQLSAASMALAGLTLSGCRRWPEEKLAPFTTVPKGRMVGVPEQYATAMELNGVAQPLLVTSFEGRPIKIEGNPIHPYSATVVGRQGAATVFAQASVLEMYDPHRSRAVMENTGSTFERRTFADFKATLDDIISKAGDGSKIAILAQSTSSPSTARLRKAVSEKFPKLAWYEYEALSNDNESLGLKSATGTPARAVLHLDKAAVVVSFDSDFLGQHPAQVKYAADWATRRRSADQGEMSRVYVFESAFTLTGTMADVRIPLTPSRAMEYLKALASALNVGTNGVYSLGQDEATQLNRVIAEINAHKGSAVVTVGPSMPAEAHHLAALINAQIGAVGNTVTIHSEAGVDRPSHFESIAALAKSIQRGGVDTLIIIGGNPVYNAPVDLDFASLLRKVPNSIHLGLYRDETGTLSKWHVPKAHYLESWSDTRAWDGSVSIVQPLIEPLFNGKTTDEFLALLAGSPETTSESIVRKTFELSGGADYAAFRKALHDGFVDKSGFETFTGTLKPFAGTTAAPAVSGFEIRYLASAGMYDGRFAPNGWLQELPDTMTKIVWDNAALLSKKDADAAGIETGDMVKITVDGRELDIVAYVLPGQPIGVIGLQLGYGRTAAGPIGSDVGFNVYELRSSTAPFVARGATIAKTGDDYSLTQTQNHYLIDSVGFKGREERTGAKGESAELIREATLVEYKADKALFKRKEDGSLALQLYDPPHPFNDPSAWGMAVDMTACIGCNACVIACQAENNIPVVGKDQAGRGRQMHWIRIDRYFKGDAKDPENDPNPEVVYQPVMCQHCENAPCEQVCPVGATMHDTEGLNVMVYNRCIGTRYCSNNCPYKVRRFNYLDWQSQDPRHNNYPKPYLGIPDQQQLEQVDPIKRMVFNPEVTVRMRGVMEKCTYCIQRIHNTQTHKRAIGEELKDGDIITACQQTCPTQAIVFGDLNDRQSQVSKLQRENPRTFSLLADLDTRPRTQYLGRVRNPAEV